MISGLSLILPPILIVFFRKGGGGNSQKNMNFFNVIVFSQSMLENFQQKIFKIIRTCLFRFAVRSCGNKWRSELETQMLDAIVFACPRPFGFTTFIGFGDARTFSMQEKSIFAFITFPFFVLWANRTLDLPPWHGREIFVCFKRTTDITYTFVKNKSSV